MGRYLLQILAAEYVGATMSIGFEIPLDSSNIPNSTSTPISPYRTFSLPDSKPLEVENVDTCERPSLFSHLLSWQSTWPSHILAHSGRLWGLTSQQKAYLVPLQYLQAEKSRRLSTRWGLVTGLSMLILFVLKRELKILQGHEHSVGLNRQSIGNGPVQLKDAGEKRVRERWRCLTYFHVGQVLPCWTQEAFKRQGTLSSTKDSPKQLTSTD